MVCVKIAVPFYPISVPFINAFFTKNTREHGIIDKKKYLQRIFLIQIQKIGQHKKHRTKNCVRINVSLSLRFSHDIEASSFHLIITFRCIRNDGHTQSQRQSFKICLFALSPWGHAVGRHSCISLCNRYAAIANWPITFGRAKRSCTIMHSTTRK